jgi:peptidoglycan/LPS O-acetylase OafA/YrhL
LTAVILATVVANLAARAKFPLPAGDRRLGCIDGLRGYLALAVAIHHFYIWVQVTRLDGSWSPPPVNFLNQLGSGGVALFFMITGLLFYPRVLDGFRETSWLRVFVSRIFRIVPLVAASFAFITLVIVARTGAALDPHYLRTAFEWIIALRETPILTYTDSGRLNSYVLWSLWFEWLFYLLVLPLCAAAMDYARGRKLATWTVPVSLLVAALSARNIGAHLGFPIDAFRYLPLFAVGMLAFECQAQPALRNALSTPLAGLAAIGALLVGMATTQFPYDVSLPLFAFFFICVACGNSLGGALSTRGALILGECSFGIYLLHGILLDVLFVDAQDALLKVETAELPLLLVGVLVLLALAAQVTYRLIELPAMRGGRSLNRLLERPRPGPNLPHLAIGPLAESPIAAQHGAQ